MAVQNFGTGGGGNQLSPGVNFSEIDLTTVTPAVATTVGAFAGVFRWGPANKPSLVTSENDLVNKFGKPTNINPETFFTAANFLSYSNSLYVTRAVDTTKQFAAVGGENVAVNTASSSLTVLNEDDFATKEDDLIASDLAFVARWPGEIGNSLKVSVCESAEQFSSNVVLDAAKFYVSYPSGDTTITANASFSGANTGFTLAVGSSTATITLDGADVEIPVYDPETNTTTIYTAADSGTIAADAAAVADKINEGDYIQVKVGNSSQRLKVLTVGTPVVEVDGLVNTGIVTISLTLDQPLKLSTNIDQKFIGRNWEYFSQVDAAPGRSTYVASYGNTALQLADPTAQMDEMHVVVADEDGAFTGTPGAILEVYKGVSRATDAKLTDGTANYFRTVINTQSQYVWVASDRAGSASNTAVNVQSVTATAPLTVSFVQGVDCVESETIDAATAIPFSSLATAYDTFVSPEEIDISLILSGKSRKEDGVLGEQLANYLIDNIAEVRQDCVVFVSPTIDTVVNKQFGAEDSVVDFRNAVRSSSYAVMDSGYKYQYDKYNDLYRWIPLNGDIAGLCVRTDNTRDPWYSPAGTARGQIRNVVKLAFNPNRAQRDVLYKNGVNPVISQPGQGTILYGDKTLLSKPSAFDRINVRRLFIILEKTISQAAKSFLFEFNDEFTRAQFINLVEPFLRDVQGRRGIYDFRVVCDESNNTPQIVDTNRFVGDIYIKPARAINFIQLNFVAVRSGVEFSEIVG